MDHQTIQSFLRLKYKLLLSGLLVVASVISVVLEKVHAWVNGSDSYSNLVFNLGLAWIPLVVAGLAYIALRNRILFYLVMPISTIVWLIFFPNAPYLLTDFQHLANTYGEAPIWFDVLVMIWFAWTGLLLGVTSLYLMQEMVSRAFSPVVGWIFAISATTVSSVGVYMGRFLRWNSWDILQDPIPIAKDMVAIVRHPIANLPTYVFTIFFTLLFLFIYVTIHLFSGVIQERRTRM